MLIVILILIVINLVVNVVVNVSGEWCIKNDSPKFYALGSDCS